MLKPRLSQNFLSDPFVITRIVEAINPKPSDKILEIGPGKGALTGSLLSRAGRLQAIDIDNDIVDFLRGQHWGEGLRLIRGNILDYDLSDLGKNVRVVGNLPYHISSPILLRVNHIVDNVMDGHFMLQKELVDRVVANPGSRLYGRLSVTLGYYWDVVKLFDVSPLAFSPTPKVWSSVFRIVRKKNFSDRVFNFSFFSDLVRVAFSQRRKTLKKSLKNYLSPEDIGSLGLNSKDRAENLSVDDFIRLSDKAIENASSGNT